STPVAPPTPQEVTRKLSIHSAVKPKVSAPGSVVSGTESDSDSVLAPEYVASTSLAGVAPLSAIAERRNADGEDTEDEEDEEDDGATPPPRKAGESDIKAGYLWKKGERRKTWKRRWFVLRSGHLAYYKTSAEYQLHRLLDLHDVHTCTAVSLKKHENSFGVVSATRTFYLQAETQEAMQAWVKAIKEAKEAHSRTSTLSQQAAGSSPIPIPPPRAGAHLPPPMTPSPPSVVFHGGITSSESEDASPQPPQRILGGTSPNTGALSSSPRQIAGNKDASKAVVSGYIMKLGSKRRNWRKRWFVLNGEKLMYSGSHMDTKPHREIPLWQILDAFEYAIPPKQSAAGHVPSTPVVSPPHARAGSEDVEGSGENTFKIVTTKRTLVLCAPSEEEEIKWLSAVRALIARRSDAGVVPGDAGGKSGMGDPSSHGQSGSGSGGTV
ncbi:PH-domain-containing protein, partial [Artomyces pyxidatus]